MKTSFATLMLLLAASYQGQCQNYVRIAMDARREGEPVSFWLSRARFLAAESRSCLEQWELWTRMAA